jgi:hypothetical protein
MRLAEFFEGDDVRLVEPLFSDLCYREMDELILRMPANKSRILIDENEEVLSVAVESDDGIIHASCCHLRAMSDQLINRLEEMDGEVYQVSRSEFEDTIRACYANDLIRTHDTAPDDLNPERLAITRDLLKTAIGENTNISCLDCCCGTGIGSFLMKEMGISPIAYDNDDALLVRGLKEKRLDPERTMWIDGRLIENYLTCPVDFAFGFMFGEIQPFNQDTWQEIISGICAVSEQVLLTVGTQKEAELIREWMQSDGLTPEIWENDRDPIYDRWVCTI